MGFQIIPGFHCTFLNLVGITRLTERITTKMVAEGLYARDYRSHHRRKNYSPTLRGTLNKKQIKSNPNFITKMIGKDVHVK
jgi:hypothetical protein